MEIIIQKLRSTKILTIVRSVDNHIGLDYLRILHELRTSLSSCTPGEIRGIWDFIHSLSTNVWFLKIKIVKRLFFLVAIKVWCSFFIRGASCYESFMLIRFRSSIYHLCSLEESSCPYWWMQVLSNLLILGDLLNLNSLNFWI